ncbi:MAG TPA: hypothetical protein PK859_18895 [Spirochaetota bacterium]|nr:hypothetical protein [Spirochaetota bacterium]HPR50078.1 hypothetical protein [Spirochaetota bacterium]
MFNIKILCIVFILSISSCIFAELGPDTPCIETSPEKIELLKKTLTSMKRNSPQGKEDFLKKIMTDSIFCGGMYTLFKFNRDGSFNCFFRDTDYKPEPIINTQGTWDVKDSKIILNFTGKQKWWSGKYTIKYYIMQHSERLEYPYGFLIGLADKTPWNDQAFFFDFK